MDVAALAGLLHEAAETHHRVYRITDGEDPDWASWYAAWLIDHSELPQCWVARRSAANSSTCWSSSTRKSPSSRRARGGSGTTPAGSPTTSPDRLPAARLTQGPLLRCSLGKRVPARPPT